MIQKEINLENTQVQGVKINANCKFCRLIREKWGGENVTRKFLVSCQLVMRERGRGRENGENSRDFERKLEI
jgi:hypothetical protein